MNFFEALRMKYMASFKSINELSHEMDMPRGKLGKWINGDVSNPRDISDMTKVYDHMKLHEYGVERPEKNDG